MESLLTSETQIHSSFSVRGTAIGGGAFTVIAGPCAVENWEMLRATAAAVKEAGASILRGGAFKPRTSPKSFQGLGEQGLEFLHRAGQEFGLPVVTEIVDPRHLPLLHRYADILQIGSRNMDNYALLAEVGKAGKPVLLKRGMAATEKELLLAAEYILQGGETRIILCERGLRGIDENTRNILDLAVVPVLKQMSRFPVFVDPSHATGRADLVAPMTRAALAAGADGVMVEVHVAPEKALCDGKQAMTPTAFRALMDSIRPMLPAKPVSLAGSVS